MLLKRAMTYSRSVLAGMSPITDKPLSFRRISAENFGAAMASCAATPISSITRAASTTEPAVVNAENLTASVGAVPESET